MIFKNSFYPSIFTYSCISYRLDEWIQKVTSQLGNRREFKLFIDEMKAQFYFIIGVVLLKKDSQVSIHTPPNAPRSELVV